MTMDQPEYEDRVVAFIDILGFREHINQTVKDTAHFKKVRNAMNYISDLKQENDQGILSQKELGKEITVFSDSIVVSYPISLKGSVFYLLIDIVHLQLEMLRVGILMRGGVTVGQLYHCDNVVYGPAMNEAYELESKIAIYPRVIVNQLVFKTAAMNHLDHHSREDEVKYVLDLLEQDFDEQYYVNFMAQWQEIDEEVDYINALWITKDVIQSSLARYATKPAILVKYQWLKGYYHSVLDSLKEDYTEGLYIE